VHQEAISLPKQNNQRIPHALSHGNPNLSRNNLPSGVEKMVVASDVAVADGVRGVSGKMERGLRRMGHGEVWHEVFLLRFNGLRREV
jgi:hypothetical protein